MARNVKISSIGKQSPRFPVEEKASYERLVEEMISFWRGQIDNVLPDKPDLIILPENCDRYWATPQDSVLPYRKTLGTRMLNEMRQVARDNKCYVVYSSTLEEEDGTWRTAAVMIDRGGEIIGQYNKNHTVVTEINYGILCGAQTPIVKCDFGTVGFVICFDLNFDELRLKYKTLHPDLLIFPSMYHGGLMEAYWAYSCRAHFVGCTGVDTLPNQFYSPVGNLLATSTNYYQPVTHTVNLDCAVAHIDFNDGKFVQMKKKYGSAVTIFDPGLLGSVLITSESETINIKDIIAEFEIELLDDYLERSLAHHHDAANRERD
jgi:hypothetical protein